MARSASGGGVSIAVDTSELLDFANKADKAAKVTKPVVAAGLNDVGDSLVATMATSLTKTTGLSLEQVRGLMKVKRANRNNLAYEVRIDEDLLGDAARKLEGGRESTNFGKQDPGRLVIVVSKKDDLVCMECEELAAAGPMPAEVAARHVPAHPECRCIILPYVQKGKRLPVTMTTVSGTDPRRRMGGSEVEIDSTLRQLTQNILDRTARTIRIELS